MPFDHGIFMPEHFLHGYGLLKNNFGLPLTIQHCIRAALVIELGLNTFHIGICHLDMAENIAKTSSIKKIDSSFNILNLVLKMCIRQPKI